LAMSRSLMERLGGTLELQSTLGQGTTVRVELPFAGPEAAPTVSAEALPQRVIPHS
ncbi:MAG: ATP-binding protein, partial [Deltaproteobacteria bacterium]|nr:ATP-binding protein [Deltaproteobacteria bacterium]